MPRPARGCGGGGDLPGAHVGSGVAPRSEHSPQRSPRRRNRRWVVQEGLPHPSGELGKTGIRDPRAVRSWKLQVGKCPRAAPSNLGWGAGANPAGAPSQRLGQESEGAPAMVFDVFKLIPEPVARHSRPQCSLAPSRGGGRGRSTCWPNAPPKSNATGEKGRATEKVARGARQRTGPPRALPGAWTTWAPDRPRSRR